jgi:hypothetical protein
MFGTENFLDQFRHVQPFPKRNNPVPQKRRQRGRWFLKGPIPGAWLEKAARLRGKSLHVGLAIWFRAGLTGKNEVTVPRKVKERLSLKSDAFRRGLAQLEKAGLVSVVRLKGRPAQVTLWISQEDTPRSHRGDSDLPGSEFDQQRV